MSIDDIELWDSVDGSLLSLRDFIKNRNLNYPKLPEVDASIPVGDASSSSDKATSEANPSVESMYVGMYRTALEMIDAER